MHPRQQIRKSVGDAIDDDRLITQPVKVGEIISIGRTNLPRVVVYTGRERVEELYSDAPRVEKRIVDLRVEIQANAESAEAAQDFLDGIAEGVEAAVVRDETQGGVAERTVYRETTVAASGEGSSMIVALVIAFDVTYPFDYGDRQLPDALGMDADIDIESETVGQIEAKVDLDLDQ